MTVLSIIIIAICTIIMVACSVAICCKEEKRMTEEYIKKHTVEYENTKTVYRNTRIIMITLEPQQKDILEKLNEIALETNWGTVERVNGVPKPISVIQEAMEEIKRLRDKTNELVNVSRNALKNPAEVFLKDLKDRSIWFIGCGGCDKDHFDEQFEEMCQNYGVEID